MKQKGLHRPSEICIVSVSSKLRGLWPSCVITFLLAMTAWAQQPTAPPQLKPAVPVRYRLHAGDVLEVQYRYTPEFNQTLTVQPDGYISLLIGGEMKALDLTLTEVHEKILEQVRVRLKDPELTVVLKEFQQPFFVVAGEVAAPGRFDLRDQVTALQAIVLAGGFKDSANTSQVLVLRRLNSDLAEVKILNLKRIKRKSDLENDLNLVAGDMIVVPRNRLSKIERYVRLASLANFVNPILGR